MTLERVVLELNADVDPNNAGKDKGVFELMGNLQVTEAGQTRFLVGGRGAVINSVTRSLLNAASRGQLDAGTVKRRGYHLDLGAGRHTFDINFLGWEGAQADTDDDGTKEYLQWGNTDDPNNVTAGDATGADSATTQMQVLTRYLMIGEFDSRAADAKLRFGEYSDGTYAADNSDGLYEDYLQVAIKGWDFNRVSESPATFNGRMQIEETSNWDDIVDSAERVFW